MKTKPSIFSTAGEYVSCRVCGTKLNRRTIVDHLHFIHRLTPRTYYLKYYCDNAYLCGCGCDVDAEFRLDSEITFTEMSPYCRSKKRKITFKPLPFGVSDMNIAYALPHGSAIQMPFVKLRKRTTISASRGIFVSKKANEAYSYASSAQLNLMIDLDNDVIKNDTWKLLDSAISLKCDEGLIIRGHVGYEITRNGVKFILISTRRLSRNRIEMMKLVSLAFGCTTFIIGKTQNDARWRLLWASSEDFVL